MCADVIGCLFGLCVVVIGCLYDFVYDEINVGISQSNCHTSFLQVLLHHWHRILIKVEDAGS
jgi:hypothetical protein